MRLLIALLAASTFVYAGAQVFPRESRFVAHPSGQTDRTDTSVLLEHMHEQQVINAQRSADIQALDQRVMRIESIKPDTIGLRLASLEEASSSQQKLLWGILAAVLINFLTAGIRIPFGVKRKED